MTTEAVRRLLAEHVDCEGYCEVWAARGAIERVEAEAVAAERARIKAAVEALDAEPVYDPADAALIVAAVNEYEALLDVAAAAAFLDDAYADEDVPGPVVARALDDLRAALRRLQEKRR